LGTFLLLGAAALFVLYLFFQVRALRRQHGWWKAFAVVPLLGMILILTRILVETIVIPTSHRLWPAEILVGSTVGLVFLGVVDLLHRRGAK